MLKFRSGLSVVLLVVSFVHSYAFAAEELIYNNSNSSVYHFCPGANMEVMDYGRSNGGNISGC